MKLLKVLIVLLMMAAVFGGGGYFAYQLFIAPEEEERREREEREVAPPTPTPDPSLEVFEQAREQYRQGEIFEAQSALELFLDRYPRSPKIDDARRLLGDINMTLLFSPPADEEVVIHEVRSGDALARIASTHGTTVDLIMRANNLQNTIIRPGQQLVIPQPDFSLDIDRSAGRVTLLNEGRFFHDYPILEDRLAAMRGGELQTEVSEKMAWHQGQRVAFGSPEYIDSTRWIVLARPGFVLFSHEEPGEEEAADVTPPATGLRLDPADMDELHALIRNRTPVLIRQ